MKVFGGITNILYTILNLIWTTILLAISPIGWVAYFAYRIAIKYNVLYSHVYPISFVILIAVAIFLFNRYSDAKDRISTIKGECDQKVRQIEKSYEKKANELEVEYNLKLSEVQTREKVINAVLHTATPFRQAATLTADMRTILYKQKELYLRHKSHPAMRAADEVKKLKDRAAKEIAFAKEMQYKYDFLLNIFPELHSYLEDDEALISLGDGTFQEFQDTRDKARDFLSSNEWASMSVDDRNQIALDRYMKSSKSKWTIGMLYEMYVGHLLRTNNFSVVQYGIKHGLNDLGRDIIATKYINGVQYIYIIQCKNWASSKQIHENVVCQIFGSAIEYDINYNRNRASKVIPALYTTAELSDTAKSFAERLGVEVTVIPLKEFPVIKCNINHGDKIYHLPFDQQYWNTDISKPGEFFASTVKEAVAKGFRRAYRHTMT